eukprot:5292637-Pleurochrysis_carterae.AAC.1
MPAPSIASTSEKSETKPRDLPAASEGRPILRNSKVANICIPAAVSDAPWAPGVCRPLLSLRKGTMRRATQKCLVRAYAPSQRSEKRAESSRQRRAPWSVMGAGSGKARKCAEGRPTDRRMPSQAHAVSMRQDQLGGGEGRRQKRAGRHSEHRALDSRVCQIARRRRTGARARRSLQEATAVARAEAEHRAAPRRE